MTPAEALKHAIDATFYGALGDLGDGYIRILAALAAVGFVVVPATEIEKFKARILELESEAENMLGDILDGDRNDP